MAEKKENPHEGHREKLRQRFIRENGFAGSSGAAQKRFLYRPIQVRDQ